jgi:hypothetical protein
MLKHLNERMNFILKTSQIILFYLCFTQILWAHPMPNSLLNLNIQEKNIRLSLQIPLSDFDIAFSKNIKDFTNPEDCKTALSNYFKKHIRLKSDNDTAWLLTVLDYQTQNITDPIVGDYSELVVKMLAKPSNLANVRQFTLYFDAILHQVVTHKILVNIAHDWENGIVEKSQTLGIIEMDVPTGKIPPLSISLEKGSFFKGFKSMVQLGMKHISEGTDHLLFLLVLLLPAPLLVVNKKWGSFGGLRFSVLKLVKIITAFTVGHSLTLFLGTLGWIPFSSKLIEIAIAFSILISAIHALKPLFYHKEIYLASGFGLIHGLAFSNSLLPLHLDNMQLGLSILGFNLGIELMQLGIMALILPCFLGMSQTTIYPFFRVVGAVIASLAAIAWMAERMTNTPNFMTVRIEMLLPYALWLIIFLAVMAVTSCFYFKKRVNYN